MEAQALSAIYESSFEIRSPKQWSILLRPVDTGVPYDPDDQDPHNHVAVQLFVQLTPLYPISETPSLDIVILRGLTQHHQQTLLTLAQEEASNNLGMPVVFAVCEAVKAWLMDHNQKGLDDTSMHAQMMRKKLEADKRTVRYMYICMTLERSKDQGVHSTITMCNESFSQSLQ
jgi:predicted nucleic acid-binding protein